MISKRLTIFEGVDGSGKTTLAKSYAAITAARYVHLGPFPGVDVGLAQLYIDAITPAVLGYQDVVLDRSWLSESIYGAVHRHGLDRLGPRTRLVERLAWRCAPLVVHAVAAWDMILAVYRSRKKREMLRDELKLREAYDLYRYSMATSLPTTSLVTNTIDLQWRDILSSVNEILRRRQPSEVQAHYAPGTAGNFNASVLIAVDGCDHGEREPLLQWPNGSLSGRGGSIWLAREFDAAGISERGLMWIDVTASMPEELARACIGRHHIFALGSDADNRLGALGIGRRTFVSPAEWRRLNEPSSTYPLIQALKEAIR